MLQKTITVLISLVWLINGLYCKILNQVTRHEAIVAQILNTEHSRSLIIFIGFLEICLAIWILTKYKYKISAIIQIVLVLSMNIIEFHYAKNLLLFGELNIIFALLFAIVIYLNNFHFNKKANNVS